MTLFTVSILAIMVTLVSGQVAPALAQTTSASPSLQKRSYTFLDDQHLTARFGNSKVCGDHMCTAGEWFKLQANLNQAQISHPANSTQHVPVTMPPSTPPPTVHVNVTSTPPTIQPPTPTPIPTPPPAPYSVCAAVKTALGNSTTSVVEKIMTDLGCNK